MKRLVVLLLLMAGGCNDPNITAAVAPVTMSTEALGHYCQMNVLEHDGPKAQVHLAGNPHPIWFVQIRDAFAFERMPEQSADVAAIFVNDMGAPGARWEAPGNDNWIAAPDAVYVIGSDRRGGMGVPDLIPFATQQDAAAFTKRHGGKVIAYSDISNELVLAPVDVDLPSGEGDIETPGGS